MLLGKLATKASNALLEPKRQLGMMQVMGYLPNLTRKRLGVAQQSLKLTRHV